MALVTFTLYSAANGQPLAGLSPTVTVLKRFNSSGSTDDLTPLPAVSDDGGGVYSFTIDDDFFELGSSIAYVISAGALASAPFLDDTIAAADVGATPATVVQVVSGGAQLADFKMKVGDLSPAIQETLPFDLAGATVKFRMRDPGSDVVKVDAAATVLSDHRTARYQWQGTDSDTRGLFRGEWVVTFSDTTVQTYPARGYMQVLISPNLSVA